MGKTELASATGTRRPQGPIDEWDEPTADPAPPPTGTPSRNLKPQPPRHSWVAKPKYNARRTRSSKDQRFRPAFGTGQPGDHRVEGPVPWTGNTRLGGPAGGKLGPAPTCWLNQGVSTPRGTDGDPDRLRHRPRETPIDATSQTSHGRRPKRRNSWPAIALRQMRAGVTYARDSLVRRSASACGGAPGC